MNDLLAILLPALAIVESSGNPKAVNAKENACGLYQIRPIYLADVNRILGKEAYTLDDRFDPQKSAEIVKIYLTHYGKVYQKQTGKTPTLEVLARIHNGGPSGWKKESTKDYWKKLRNKLERKFD